MCRKRSQGGKRETILADEDGVTLIELLVALSIFAVLMASAALSFSLFPQIVRKANLSYAAKTRNLAQLRDQLASTFYFIGERNAVGRRGEEFFEYFYGGPTDIVFVASQSLKVQGLALTHIFWRDGKLLLAETPLYDKRFPYMNPRLEERGAEDALVLAEGDSVDISYLTQGEWEKSLNEKIPGAVKIDIRQGDRSEVVYASIGADFPAKLRRVEWSASAL